MHAWRKLACVRKYLCGRACVPDYVMCAFVRVLSP